MDTDDYRRETWLDRKEDCRNKKPAASGERHFVRGEEFLFLGRLYPLEVLEGSNAGISLGDRLYIGEGRLPECRELLKQWYAEKAAEILPARSPGSQQFSIMFQKKYGSRIHEGVGLRAVRPERYHSAGVLSLPLRKLLITSLFTNLFICASLITLIVSGQKSKRRCRKYQHHRRWLRENERMLAI